MEKKASMKKSKLYKLFGYTQIKASENNIIVDVDYGSLRERVRIKTVNGKALIRSKYKPKSITIYNQSNKKILAKTRFIPFSGCYYRLVRKKSIAASKSNSPSDLFWVSTYEKIPPKVKSNVSNNIAIIDTKSLKYKSLRVNLKERSIQDIAVVIPVYRAYEDVKLCVESIIKYTPKGVDIYIFDDYSQDDNLESLFVEYEQYDNFHIVRQPFNLGFTKNVNSAFRHIPQHKDIILQNSDTIVGPRWLEGLFCVAYSEANVGTVTAVSNGAGAFSVPEKGMNDIPNHLSLEAMSRLFLQYSHQVHPTVPTGNGFCLYITSKARQAVPLLDEEAFPKGYGEENDFCLKLKYQGFKHKVADNIYVYHKRTGSFTSEEKEKHLKKGLERLHRRYPQYKNMLRASFEGGGEVIIMREEARKALSKALEEQFNNRPRILYVLSPQTGGTPQTNKDLMSSLEDRYDPFLLVMDHGSYKLYHMKEGSLELLEQEILDIKIDYYSHRCEEVDGIFMHILLQYGIELTHIRHLAKLSVGVSEIAHQLNIPVVYSLHDFYTMCPTTHYLNDKMEYCKGDCHNIEGPCYPNLDANFKHIDFHKHEVKNWRLSMKEFLKYCYCFISTSDSVKDMFEQTFPDLNGQDFHIIPHGRDFSSCNYVIDLYVPQRKIKILILGNIGPHKGAHIVQDLLDELDAKKFEIHILGKVSSHIKVDAYDHCIYWGAYERDNLQEKIQAINPDLGLIISIWPETYCHTLTENWVFGIPVVGVALGAVKDRMADGQRGWALELSSELKQDIHFLLQNLYRNPQELITKQKQAISLRLDVICQTSSAMSDDYSDIYQNILKIKNNI